MTTLLMNLDRMNSSGILEWKLGLRILRMKYVDATACSIPVFSFLEFLTCRTRSRYFASFPRTIFKISNATSISIYWLSVLLLIFLLTNVFSFSSAPRKQFCLSDIIALHGREMTKKKTLHLTDKFFVS